MKIYNVRQGTSEWLELRAGIPTASSFDKIITPKGAASKSAEKYMWGLLAERLMGHPTIEHVSLWMARGSQLEADAVAFYELQSDCDTVPIGFVTNDAGTIVASPDRLVGDNGLLEIKCPSEAIHMGYLLQSGTAYDEYKIQCQGQLWITGKAFVDILSWHPELPPALHRIHRDEDFIEKLSAAVTAFSEVLETNWLLCKTNGWCQERKETADTFKHLPPLKDLVEMTRRNHAEI